MFIFKKKVTALLLIVFFSFCTFLHAQNFAEKIPKPKISPPNQELKTGESLQYTIQWLGIPVGKAFLKVHGIVKLADRDCYHISAEGKPNSLLKKIIDLEYRVESFIDKELFVSRRFLKSRILDGEHNYVEIDFDPEKGRVRYESKGSSASLDISKQRLRLSAEVPSAETIPPGTQDLLSAFYYLRQIDLGEESSYPVNIYYAQKNWQADFTVDPPYFRDIRRKGSFLVFRASPSSGLNDFIFGQRKFSICFTADPRRIPLEFKFITGLGSIEAILDKIPE